MKRILALLFVGAALLGVPAIASPGHASAVDIFKHTCDAGQPEENLPVCSDVKTQQDSKKNPIITVMKLAITVLSIIVGAASTIGVLAGSLKLVSSGGDSGAVASARSSITYSLIGLVVVVLAQALVVFVLNKVA